MLGVAIAVAASFADFDGAPPPRWASSHGRRAAGKAATTHAALVISAGNSFSPASSGIRAYSKMGLRALRLFRDTTFSSGSPRHRAR